MTEKQNDKAAETPDHPEKGRTWPDVALTVYADVKASETGQVMGETALAIAKAGKAVVVPIGSGLVWCSEKVVNFVRNGLDEKLKDVPPENIQPPNPAVAGDILQALQFRIDEEFLREMFLNLLAASMDKTRADSALPEFVEVIKRITPDEAKTIRHLAEGPRLFPLIDIFTITGDDYKWEVFTKDYAVVAREAGCEFPDNVCAYMENLHRLGLIDIRGISGLLFRAPYEALQATPEVQEMLKQILHSQRGHQSYGKCGHITEFGVKFYRACMGK